MRYISVCSGIEAATLAWHPLGWAPAAFSEIEAFPRAVLEHHYPGVPLHGDFTTIERNQYGKIDLLVGGTPCQSFSIAGLRGGLDDHRGNLALEFMRLADRERPCWIVWENVPGVLSSNGGRDFGSILGALGELGYGFAYRILDAQHFGVPQRRRRVFVVGYLGDWRRAAAVLFERHSLQGHSAPRRETGQGFATDVAPSLVSSGRGVERTGETRGQDPVIAVASTGLISHCLNAGGMGRQDYETETLIAHSLRGEGFDASEDGTGRGTPLVPVHTAPTMQAGGNSTGGNRPYGTTVDTCEALVTVAFKIGAGAAAGSIGLQEECAPTLSAGESGTQRSPGLLQGSAVRRLTPRECERLQGFPDDYTQVPYRNKPAADGPRYKALGNSMAVPVMRWIGERIEREIARGLWA